MIPVKELHYFDRSVEYPTPNHLSETQLRNRLAYPEFRVRVVKKILQHLKTFNRKKLRWWCRYYLKDYTDTWYLSLFKDAPGITGDITPSYCTLKEEDIRRMYTIAPEAKLIFILRNPIDRAWSMLRKSYISKGKIASDDIEALKQFIDTPAQSLRSDYLRAIGLFSIYYPRERFKIGFYDSILEDPQAFLMEVQRYLGANHVQVTKSCGKRVNVSKSLECPDEVRRYLEEKYRSQIETLASRYGSHATNWAASLNGKKEITHPTVIKEPLLLPA